MNPDEQFESFSKFINDSSAKVMIEKKRIGAFSDKNTLKFETTVRSARSFRSINIGKVSRHIFKNVRFRIDLWAYIPKINPLGQFRIIWDIFIGSSTLYLFFAISVSLSFSKLVLPHYLPFFIAVFVIGIIIDFNTGYYEQGILIKNRRLAAQNYLCKYFIFDLISTICLVIQAFNSDLQYVVALFFLKSKYFSKISKIFKEVLHLKPIFHNIISFCKLISVIIFAAHFFACIYISIVTYFTYSINWVEKQELNLQTEVFRVYVRAFYYSCVTMMTVGYGDVTPQNDLEYSVVIFTVLIGCIFFGYSLNKIGSIFNEMEEQDKLILKNLFIINQYMSRKDIQKDLQFQVREYLTYYWSQNNSTENKASEQIISQLSEGLKQKLQIQATRKVLNQCSIFRSNFSDEFLQKASTLIKGDLTIVLGLGMFKCYCFPYYIEYRCYPDEIITFQGDVDDCSFFFVEQGNAIMYFSGNQNFLGKNDTSIDIKELKKGDTFGFYSFFTGQPRKLTIKSSGFTKYKHDYEIFCTISDSLQAGITSQRIHSDCYCCQYNDHMVTDCPKIHLIIDKIELSQRDLKQVRDNEFQRKVKRQRVILEETRINQYIQNELFYLQAYHQLFIGAFDNWYEQDDYDDDDEDEYDEDEQTYQKENYMSIDKVSIVQDYKKIKSKDQGQGEDDVQQKPHSLSYQRTQEKKMSLISDNVGQKMGGDSLHLITDIKPKDIIDLSIQNQTNQIQQQIKQLNFLQNEKKKSHTSSLTRIHNQSFSSSHDDNNQQQQQYQQYQQQQSQQQQQQQQQSLQQFQQQHSSGIPDQSTIRFTNQFQDQQALPSLQIKLISNNTDSNLLFSPQKKKKKKSLGDSFSDLERIQVMQQQSQDNQIQNPFQQQQQLLPYSQKQNSQTQISPTSPIQNQSQQQLQIQQFIQSQQNILTQQHYLQQQAITQQLQQILQLATQSSPHNSNQLNQGGGVLGGGGWQSTAQTQLSQQMRRGSALVLASQNQNQFNFKAAFPLEFANKPLNQLLDFSSQAKTQNSISNINSNDFMKQPSQNSQFKGNKQSQYSQQQTLQMNQNDKLMLLQKLNQNSQHCFTDFFSNNEEDCKMKIYDLYFPEWNFDAILQKINIDNGFSVNSSEILQTTEHKVTGKMLKQQGKGNKQQMNQNMQNKRVTSIIYQNANEKKVQEALSSLNQTATRNMDESNINDPNSLNLPATPFDRKSTHKGKTMVIPTIQEQNQQLAALKFTHQNKNEKFIVFRKQNPSNHEISKTPLKYLTDEQIIRHAAKLKEMKRKSISVDVDLTKNQKSNFILPSPQENTNINNNNISRIGLLDQLSFYHQSQNTKANNLDQSVNTFGQSENIIQENNDDLPIPLTVPFSNSSSVFNNWSQYIKQKQ